MQVQSLGQEDLPEEGIASQYSYLKNPMERGASWAEVHRVTVRHNWSDLAQHSTALPARSCLTLWGPMDCSPSGSSVHGISQARILEWVAISFSRGSSQPRDWTCVSCIGRQILYLWATWETHCPLTGRLKRPMFWGLIYISIYIYMCCWPFFISVPTSYYSKDCCSFNPVLPNTVDPITYGCLK